MEACCTVQSAKHNHVLCPHNQVRGKAVGRITVQAIVRDLKVVGDDDYFVCESADCPVVYYSHQTQIEEDKLRETMYAKHKDNPEQLICYCFQHTTNAIHNIPSIADDISTQVKLGRCACEARNPKGRCCLGDVRAVAKMSQSAL